MPLDPISPDHADAIPPMAPPYVNEDGNLSLVEQGMEAAETERREAVSDTYEAFARLEDDPDEALDGIDYAINEGSNIPPELQAMHEEFPPDDDEDDV